MNDYHIIIECHDRTYWEFNDYPALCICSNWYWIKYRLTIIDHIRPKLNGDFKNGYYDGIIIGNDTHCKSYWNWKEDGHYSL